MVMSSSRRRQFRTRALSSLAATLLTATAVLATDRDVLLRQADEAFERRARDADGIWAQAEPIASAIAGYREALELAPDDVSTRTKLMHAIFFQAEYHFRDPARRKAAFDRGCEVFEDGLERLSRDVGTDLYQAETSELPRLLRDRPEAGPFFFWGALHWGLWGQYFGKMAGLRAGVAKKIRILGEAAMALSPEFENGGGHRLVGRLHALAPRVPLITGWVRRDRGVELLEEAYRLAPNDPLNRLFLGQVLLEFRKERTDEALALIRSAAQMKPRPDKQLEDVKAIADAEEALDALESVR